jgi:hypothetical protein
MASTASRPDIVIPIVFPDYKIDTETFLGKVGGLGHAGVLIIQGSTSLTKYYEFGRYDAEKKGLVERRSVPNVTMDADNRPSRDSLQKTLERIATVAGHRGRIYGTYIEVPGKFPTMEQYAANREKQNGDPNREPYSIMGHSCLHFMVSVTESGGVDVPWVLLSVIPAAYMDKFREKFSNLDYDPNVKTDALTIRPMGVGSKQVPSWATKPASATNIPYFP